MLVEIEPNPNIRASTIIFVYQYGGGTVVGIAGWRTSGTIITHTHTHMWTIHVDHMQALFHGFVHVSAKHGQGAT